MTFSEENYLKIIYHLGQERQEEVTTNAIAEAIQTKASHPQASPLGGLPRGKTPFFMGRSS